MNLFRLLLAAALIAPGPAFAQNGADDDLKEALKAAGAKAEARAVRKVAAAPSAGGPKGDGGTVPSPSAPMSTNPTKVSLPSFSGPSAQASSAAGAPMCGAPERQELDRLTSLNMIEQQKGAAKLRSVNDEREEAAARYNALYEKQKLEIAPLEYELRRLQLDANLQEEKFKKELSAMRQERERLRLANEVAREKLASDQIKADADKLKMDVAMRDLDFESRKLRMDAELADHKTVALKTDLDLRAKSQAWKKEANREPDYPLQPFKDGILTVSDRSIPLNGPIIDPTADAVTERIAYFNNKDEKLPIFIVIDDSPGGSVMAGYRILKAIQTSKAPVHVVVKSFAASMAAIILTTSPHSYVYPSALVLHHQPHVLAYGNPVQQKEQLDTLNEWYRRLEEPIAKKLGMSLDGFTKAMYKHNSEGDWREFGDEAVRLNWADHVVQEIRETGVLKDPDEAKKDSKARMFGLAEETDPQGKRFVRLPRLQAYDAYFIVNHDDYYR